MEITKTHIDGLWIIEPKVFGDKRGYFIETYRESMYKEAGISSRFIQDNESMSNRGVIRGLHYQIEPYSQAKLVRVIQGMVFDVALDLRKNSPSFGKWFGVVLSGENKKQFYIPKGFAHGFSVLKDETIFAYKCDNIYNPESERGIKYNDPSLEIDWMIKPEEAIISEKDLNNPTIADAEYNFSF
jgi:dTDP-4-dehydrorhamnose 3,5-epimerase